MVIDNNFYMNLALKEAWKYQGLTYPNPAVGCCIVGINNELLSVEAHKKSGQSHAEVEALRSAYFKITNDSGILDLDNSLDIHQYLLNNHNNIFHSCSLYTTLEPCSHQGQTPSCANLISSLGIKKVFVGSLDSNPEASCGNKKLLDSGIELSTAILKNECDALLKPFNHWKKNNFVFFKWAQRLNGSTNDGIISSVESRKNVHAMRNVCDLLVIGGNTVRMDRPTLDSRLVDGRAPDVLIISREKEFDKSIPLFSVEDRQVFIENNFTRLNDYKNIMIEGTASMYDLSHKYVDMYLSYIAPKFGGTDIFNVDEEKLKILNILQETQDIIMWMEREK